VPRPGRFTPEKENQYPLNRGSDSSVGIRSPDLRARGDMLYRLSYSGTQTWKVKVESKELLLVTEDASL
jgi:hypothetical protein